MNTGALLTMSVSANGGTPPYKYAWKKDGQPVDGQTTDTFSKPGAQSADAGKYTCVVTDSAEESTECDVCLNDRDSGAQPPDKGMGHHEKDLKWQYDRR